MAQSALNDLSGTVTHKQPLNYPMSAPEPERSPLLVKVYLVLGIAVVLFEIWIAP